jgi:hypothetical protein
MEFSQSYNSSRESNMAENEDLLLLQRLFARNADGRIVWAPFSSEREFITRVGEYQITISERDDPEYPDQPDYFLTISDKAGNWIATISNITLRPLLDREFNGMNPYVLLQTIYRTAHRSALGVDKVVHNLLDLLKD